MQYCKYIHIHACFSYEFCISTRILSISPYPERYTCKNCKKVACGATNLIYKPFLLRKIKKKKWKKNLPFN